MIHTIKINKDGSISLNQYRSQEDIPKGSIEITKEHYNEIIVDSTKEPFGKYKDGKWVGETKAEKEKRQKANHELVRERINQRESKEDSDFLKIYKRLKAAGKLT